MEKEVSSISGSLNSELFNKSDSESVKVKYDIRIVESSPVNSNVGKGVSKVAPHEDDWVDPDARRSISRSRTSSSLRLLVDGVDILEMSVPDHAFSLWRCSSTDLIFHSQGSSNVDFFFMYSQVVQHACVRLPLDEFTMNVPPSQLHPNSWAYLRAF